VVTSLDLLPRDGQVLIRGPKTPVNESEASTNTRLARMRRSRTVIVLEQKEPAINTRAIKPKVGAIGFATGQRWFLSKTPIIALRQP
jgi:hypothetical protein